MSGCTTTGIALFEAIAVGDEDALRKAAGFSGRNPMESAYSAIVNNAVKAEKVAGKLLLDVIARSEGEEAETEALQNYREVHARTLALSERFFGGFSRSVFELFDDDVEGDLSP
ncbi:hypothetical protein [Rhizobium leguminosarum]|uniref:hypothetical protein n=1 Tax=Rhizobium leguminosarum TaxID=384 RepID=UPI001C978A04|nr:hypothetical protein [Rhizobium leguminosarum]MBY5439326.1 hypothetical protein [Rhizobium leguminosarum]